MHYRATPHLAVIAVLALALVVSSVFAVWQAVGAPWQASSSAATAEPTPSHRWSDTEAVAVVKQALMQGPFGPRSVSVSCAASPLESSAEWQVTCPWAGRTCKFHVYEESRAVVAPDTACASALVRPQRDCPPCECNY